MMGALTCSTRAYPGVKLDMRKKNDLNATLWLLGGAAGGGGALAG